MVEALGVGSLAPPVRPQGLQALGEAGAGLEALAAVGCIARAERVAQSELEPVQAQLVGQHVHQRLMRDRTLRHAEAAEGTGGRAVGVDAAAGAAGGAHGIGAGGVDRHAARHGRAPGGVGAGIEVAVKKHGSEPAVGVGTGAGRDPGRMALGRGRHALGPGPGHAHRLAGDPGCYRQDRLEERVQLAAEPAAAGRGDDPHLLGCDPQHARHFVPVHVGCLRGGEDLDPVALAHGVAGLGLDIGVLDEAGLDRIVGGHERAGEQGLGIAAAPRGR